jgi:2-polyprenyl-3-methyl-5-hydroxy-6-metoxy-1,4-benzoquinol methylase
VFVIRKGSRWRDAPRDYGRHKTIFETASESSPSRLLASTLNRTLRGFAIAIVGAEYVLRWLEPRTHH